MRQDPRSRLGRSLLELCVCVALVAIMIGATAPISMYLMERQQAAAAVETLRGIWSAQRLYRLQQRRYASSLDELVRQGYATPSFLVPLRGYQFQMQSSADSFVAAATREGSSWQGAFSISSDGIAEGGIRSAGSLEILAEKL